MYIEAALAALLLGLILGGSPKKLLELKLRGLMLLIGAAVVSLLPRIPALGSMLAGLGTPAAYAAAGLRYGLLILFAVLNWRSVPICIIGAGGLCNFAVTMANGGRMPVSGAVLSVSPGSQDVLALQGGDILNYTLENSATLLRPLGDIIQVKIFSIYFLSIGDILILAGLFALIIISMKTRLPGRLFLRLRAGYKKNLTLYHFLKRRESDIGITRNLSESAGDPRRWKAGDIN